MGILAENRLFNVFGYLKIANSFRIVSRRNLECSFLLLDDEEEQEQTDDESEGEEDAGDEKRLMASHVVETDSCKYTADACTCCEGKKGS
ncbi:hypothetical protein AVEN_182972-1 [Araneus ventricosus]|uniref:Uncharacterized protein n=1 Tax=Araneus ventricosus TaxID=182803 RepID=A0A4Y2WL03_ARAVE|nr:hypothetical protein AVEN_182972-1 [Araneus ventricosus]